MLHNNLIKSVLLNPVLEQNADELLIVSGYAASTMASWHLNQMREEKRNFKIKLIVGMCQQGGIAVTNHAGFQQLAEDFSDNFECSYVTQGNPVHSKVYTWLKNSEPILGFIGSANYTQPAFRGRQREVMDSCNPQQAYDYFHSLTSDTIYCTHNDIPQLIQLYSDPNLERVINNDRNRGREESLEQLNEIDTPQTPVINITGLPHIRLSWLVSTGTRVGSASSLNWGQRPRREPNQAYIPVPISVARSGFFPFRGTHFRVLTDDGAEFFCRIAQDDDKAIETPHNNSLLGRYIRLRIGLPLGTFVYKEDLERYGRTHIDFYKIDDETYFMDFSRPAV